MHLVGQKKYSTLQVKAFQEQTGASMAIHVKYPMIDRELFQRLKEQIRFVNRQKLRREKQARKFGHPKKRYLLSRAKGLQRK